MLIIAFATQAQGFPSGGAGGSDRIEGKFKFVPLPYLDYDRALGASLGLVPMAIQGEYRWNFHPRIGVVGYAGLATVFGSNNEEHNGRLLPGIGTGFRYVFMKDTHSTIGFDIAQGDGDWGMYFRFSEAF